MSEPQLVSEALAEANRAIPDGPVFMLNLLRYRPRATYARPTNDALPVCSGRDAYHQRYIPAFGQLAPPGIAVLWVGKVLGRLVGPPDERWDEIAIVEYPTFATFRALVESERYLAEAAPHRVAALEDWRLVPMAKLVLG